MSTNGHNSAKWVTGDKLDAQGDFVLEWVKSRSPHIEPGDVELLEAAGVPEYPAQAPEGP